MWGIITFVIGMLYGWFSPGREDKSRLLLNGLWIGLLLGLVFALIGFFAGAGALGFTGGFLGTFLTVVLLTVIFVLGAWLGDVLEGAFHKGGTQPGRGMQRNY